MLICALGSRYVEDERTCYKSTTGEVLWHSAGWDFYRQVILLKRKRSHTSMMIMTAHALRDAGPYILPTSLFELQYCTLCSLFLLGCSAGHAAWLTTAEGLRFCQDAGAHRQKVCGRSMSTCCRRLTAVIGILHRGPLGKRTLEAYFLVRS